MCCSYWLVEREGNETGYRKGVLCVVIWGYVLYLLVGGEGGKLKGLQKGVLCVVMCRCVPELLVGGGNWKGLQKVGCMCCNVGMCAVVTGWWRGREMGRVTERGFYVQ